jgi:hypothetical protein
MARTLAGPALLVLVCGVLAAVPLYRDLGWLTLASALLALAGSHALTRNRLLAAGSRARFGWCGALPLRAHATPVMLLALAVLALIAAVSSGGLLLVCVALPAPYRDNLGLGLLVMDGGLMVGTLAAVVQVLHAGAAVRSRHADGIREPLFAWPWLNDPRLPHLLDWQRRCALVRWRSGSNFALIGIVLAGVPMGAAMLDVAGLVVLALALAWLAVVMRACMTATADARSVLAATPLRAEAMRLTSLRYPLLAVIGAMLLAAIGVLLLHAGFAPMAVWMVCAATMSSWPLSRIVTTSSRRWP